MTVTTSHGNDADHALFNSGIEFCGELNNPGLAVDFTQYVDFSRRETTEDQQRIETVLAATDLRKRRLLHIGIGNSQLARRFSAQGALVEGVTVSAGEKAHGEALSIPGYRIHRANKYSRAFGDCFPPEHFDCIVDNNLASFACCRYHFYIMLENYLGCLKSGGRILTDQRGMDWALADRSFILDFADLCRLGRRLALKVEKLTGQVYALRRPAQPRRGATDQPLCVHALRRKPGTGESYVEVFQPDQG